MAGPDQTNPLSKYFRQPKIYLRLPSKGKFYPPGVIDMPAPSLMPRPNVILIVVSKVLEVGLDSYSNYL